MTRSFIVSLIAAAACVALSTAARADGPQVTKVDAAAKPATPLKLGLSSPLGIENGKKDGHAVANALSAALARPVEVEVLSPKELEEKLAEGKLDIGWLTATEYIDASKKNAKIAPVAKMLHAGLPFYRSVIFALKTSKVSALADLKGKKLGFVKAGSAAGHTLPKQILLRAGLTADEIKKHETIFEDHAAVCKAVLAGKVDAGATISNDKAGATLAGCSETVGKDADQLKILSTSDPIPNDVFALKADAPAAEFAALRAALLGLGNTDDGKKLLAEHMHGDGFVTSEDDDFKLARELLK